MSAFCWVSTMEEMESNIVHDLTAMGYEEDEITNALHETQLRLKWKVRSECLIYSRSSRTWCDGFIMRIFNDETTNQEWLMVQYRRHKKRIQRFSDCLKPISFDESFRQQRILVLHITQRLKTALQDTSLMVTNPSSSAVDMYIEQTPQRPKAPVLWIYDIDQSTATVKVTSDFNDNDLCIIYRVRYRKFGEHESEEIMEWTERRSTAKISGLSSNTKYVIDADYCIMGSNVWSEVSTQIFNTFDVVKTRIFMILSYWMRTIMDVSHETLKDLVLRYFFVPKFEWNPNRRHYSFELSNDNKTFTKYEPGDYCNNNQQSICSGNMVSGTAASWEITVRQRAEEQTSWFMIGFMASKYINRFKSEIPCGRESYEVMLAVLDEKTERLARPAGVYWNCSLRNLNEDICIPHVDSKFRFDFDFIRKRCAVFYNDNFMGFLCKNLPESIHLVASVGGAESILETTLFQVF